MSDPKIDAELAAVVDRAPEPDDLVIDPPEAVEADERGTP